MLPKIATRKYKIKLPSVKNDLFFRPFIVAEHKLLLEIRGLEDDEGLYRTVIEILNNCLFNKIDVEQLPVHEIDYLFLNIKAKSSGESVTAIFTCDNPECGKQTPVNLDLTSATIKTPDEFSKNSIIFIDDEKTSGIKLKPPSFIQTKDLKKDKTDIETFNLLSYSIVESIFTPENVYIPGNDFSAEELIKYIDSLPERVLIEIKKYIEHLPYVSLDLKVTCPHCKNKKQIEVKELESFFD